MSIEFRDVGNFHRKFALDTSDDNPGPKAWNDEMLAFRSKFMEEELDEFYEGRAEHDHAKMADALIDLVYVAMGTAHLLGYPWEQLWAEVQAANMQKQRARNDGSDSKRGSSLDVIKPAGWTPPNIEGVLRKWGFRV